MTHLGLCLLKPSLESPSRERRGVLDGQQERQTPENKEEKEQRQKTEQLIR